MNKQNQPKKPNPNTNKTSSFKFFLPYILLVILIGVIVYFTFFGQRNDIHQLDYISLQQWILDHDIVEVTTKTSPELVIINGMTSNGEHFVAEIGRENYDNVIFNMLNAEATIERWYQVDLTKPTFWEAWGPTILTLVAVTIIVVFIMTRLVSGANATNQKAMDFNRSRARLESKRTKTFKDVAGCDAEKQEMAEIVDYLKQPKKYTQFGAKIPNGILLVGPPGTGKTLLAKAVAGEAGVPFYSISGSDFVEMFVGVGAGRVRDMFRQAKKNAPCIVFIDELDAVGRQRGTGMGGGNDEREQTLNQLLVEMDGFSDNSGVIVIAATNRDDVLDPALLRAGRFDRKITVSLPDRKGRAAIFAVHARGKKISSLVDFDQLAKRTVGFSGADIESILNDAAILAVRLNKKEIDIYDIDEAIDRRIAGPARDSVGMNEKERRTVAYHEAGHAIIGIYNKNADKVQKITIIPRGRTGGHVLMTPEEDRFLLTKNELTARIIGYLAGRVSEEIFFDDVSTQDQYF